MLLEDLLSALLDNGCELHRNAGTWEIVLPGPGDLETRTILWGVAGGGRAESRRYPIAPSGTVPLR